jgi:hypothetical protein
VRFRDASHTDPACDWETDHLTRDLYIDQDGVPLKGEI